MKTILIVIAALLCLLSGSGRAGDKSAGYVKLEQALAEAKKDVSPKLQGKYEDYKGQILSAKSAKYLKDDEKLETRIAEFKDRARRGEVDKQVERLEDKHGPNATSVVWPFCLIYGTCRE